MNYYLSLMQTFIVILAFCLFVSFFCLYFFGWYTDKRLRLVMKRIKVKPFEKLFLNFRGMYKNKTSEFSAICVWFERAGLAMLAMIPLSLLAARLMKNIVVMCRAALVVMIVSIAVTVLMMIYSGSVFNKHMREKGKKAKKSGFRELDDLSSGFDTITTKNSEAENPAAAENPAQSAKAEEIKNFKEDFNKPKHRRSFYRPVVQNSKLESLTDARQKIQANGSGESEPAQDLNRHSRSFYRPVVQNSKLESLTDARQKIQANGSGESEPAQDLNRHSRSFYRPVVQNSKLESLTDARQKIQANGSGESEPAQDYGSSEIRQAIDDFKQKNPIADENIVIKDYSQVSNKYRGVKMRSKFADEDSLEQGREILKKRKEDLAGSTDDLIDTSGQSDLEILKTIKENQKNDDYSEVGSVKDMIDENKREIRR